MAFLRDFRGYQRVGHSGRRPTGEGASASSGDGPGDGGPPGAQVGSGPEPEPTGEAPLCSATATSEAAGPI